MDNQHRKISGYRELSPAEIDLVNRVKEQGRQLEIIIDETGSIPDTDTRAIAIGIDHLQTGLMWLVRGITRPDGF